MKKYSDSHEWVELQGQEAIVGVSEHAQKELGEVVYVELPEIGKEVKVGQEAAVLESTKAAADVYAPISGVIVAVNHQLQDQSELINRSPEADGWIFKLKPTKIEEMDHLLSAQDYHTKFPTE